MIQKITSDTGQNRLGQCPLVVLILTCVFQLCDKNTWLYTPINNWLFSCKWMCPSAGASCNAGGSSLRRSDASFTFRSTRTRCHLLSFSGKPAFTRTSTGPLPTSKEKRTSVEAATEKKEKRNYLWGFNKVLILSLLGLFFTCEGVVSFIFKSATVDLYEILPHNN